MTSIHFPRRQAFRPARLSRTPIAIAVGLALAGGMMPAQAVAPAPGAALGDEFQVNTTTTGDQGWAAVAMDAAGDFVVSWTDYDGADGDGYGVFAQRYHADGTADGTAFRVNTTTTGNQRRPAVAMDAVGDFVVSWTDTGGADGDGYGVFARRYHADGTADGTAFRVNTTTTGYQWRPAVAMDADGDFVVSWTDTHGADGDGYGVFAQRYHADGTADGTAFRVNTTTTGDQADSAVAMDAAGDLVVSWTDYGGADGDGWGVFAQRYDADGTADGTAFRVNTTTTGDQERSAVAMDAAGDVVVSWTDYNGADSDGVVVFARRYDADGTAYGTAFRVNTTTTDDQWDPAVAMDAAGDVVVSWTDTGGADGSGAGIFAQRYHADGTAYGTAFRVNTTTTGNQRRPAVAMDAAGDFVVSWTDEGGADGDGWGVFARRYARDSSLDLKAGLAIAPADTVEPGGGLTLTAIIANAGAPSTLTGNATIDNALTTASGLTATLTLPDNVTFGKATGTHWTCPAAPAKDGTLTCTYDASLAAASETGNLTVSLTAPDTDDTQLAFTNTVFGAQPDTATDNNTASTSVTVKVPPPDNNGGGTSPTATASSGGGGAFGWLGLGLLGLVGLRRRI